MQTVDALHGLSYRPLKPREFRILLLSNEERNGPKSLQCELRTLNIDTNLAYVALSYTWGDSGDFATITLGSVRIRAQRNLVEALRTLYNLGHRLVWADALCINQTDLAERGVQVSLMRNVFERAQEVLIFLDSVSDRASVPEPLLGLLCASHADTVCFLSKAEVVMQDMRSYAVLRNLLKSRYWQRAWIIQEIAVASRVNVVLANHKIPWSNLSILGSTLMSVLAMTDHNSIARLSSDMDTDDELADGVAWLFSLDIIRTQKGTSLLNILNISAGSKQREDIDVLYSKLGLAFDTSQLIQRPDYSKTCREVFVELANNYIREKKSLKVICSANLQSLKYEKDLDITSLGLPSWIPDWRQVQEFSFIKLIFSAAGEHEADLHLLPHAEVETLVVQGFTYDVCGISPGPLPRPHPLPTSPVSPLDATEAMEVTASFCRTVLANHFLITDWSCAEVLPPRDLLLFQQLLCQYYERGIVPEQPRMGRSGDTGYFEKVPMMFDSWASLTIHGHQVKDWVLACKLPSFKSGIDRGKSVQRLVHSFRHVLGHSRVVEGDRGGIALVPSRTSPGDKICVLAGCEFPMLIRESQGRHTVIGCCYVDGIMHGEAMRQYTARTSVFEEFYLI
ncbi:hypothetical protein LTR33_004655 [Friedmanniomyces endolithicus]|nr:hypothetical protein LTR33_004655 [Friedmanniomyces endolithicus]